MNINIANLVQLKIIKMCSMIRREILFITLFIITDDASSTASTSHRVSK